jgi:K+/H+ antiporter YhaU regulatory subunit KhtT
VGRLVFFLILATAGALLLVPRFMDAVARTHVHELVVTATVAIVVLFGVMGAWAGSAALGAFVAGIAASEAGSRFVIRNSMASVRDLALVVFFLASGLSVNPHQAWASFGLAAGAASVFLVAMVVVNVPASIASGLGIVDALRVGLGLATLGEFSLILVSAAEEKGTAHAGLRDTVVGAMLFLLILVPILLRMVPWLARGVQRLPPRVLQGGQVLLRSWHPQRADPGRPNRLRRHARGLASNLLLFVTWIAVALAVGPLAVERAPRFPVLAPILVVGVAVSVAVPILWGTYRAYRRFVVDIVGGGRTDDPSAKLRGRLLDGLVGITVAILVLPLALIIPDARWPVLMGGAFLAVILLTLLWRQLASVQRTLQDSVIRVLGEDRPTEQILDKVVAEYAWGVRFAAVAVPLTSPLANRKLGEGRIYELTGATVAVLQRRGREVVSPGPEELLHPGDTLILMGDDHQISRAEALVVAHGEALRLSAQSKAAQVAELTVQVGSALVGIPLGEADLRGKSGALVVGVWPKDADHPSSYRPSLSLTPGDRLVVLGTGLQINRARLLAEGEGQEETLDGA